MNAHALTSFGAGTELTLSLSDAISMEGLAEKWEIGGAQLLVTLNALPVYTLACLEWWANGFWYGAGSERDERDTEAYVAVLARP